MKEHRALREIQDELFETLLKQTKLFIELSMAIWHLSKEADDHYMANESLLATLKEEIEELRERQR